MKLLSHLSPEGDGIPGPADSRRAVLGFEAWHEALVAEGEFNSGAALPWSATPVGKRLLASIFGNSPFLSGVAIREQGFLTRIVEEGADPVFAEIAAAVEISEDLGEDTTALMRRLRVAKRRVSLLAAVAELIGAWTLEQQTAALSRFAEAALGAVVRHLLRQAQTKGSAALVSADEPERDSGLIVLGMGKLGGNELNYSSDIDLILLYDPNRAPVSARDGIQSFFVRVARDLVRILDERTADGYVFRTDLRLRPDPASTPPALSVAAALAYYESVGQNWERAALIKARPVAGDKALGKSFLKVIRTFVYRKAQPKAILAQVMRIKRLIDQKMVAREESERNVKLGRGGIREVELAVQTLQAMFGAAMPVQERNTEKALGKLFRARLIGPGEHRFLLDGYWFLRNVEHKLQMVEEQQTHTLSADPVELHVCALRLGYKDAEEAQAEELFRRDYARHAERIHDIFVRVLAGEIRPGRTRPVGVRALM